LPCRVQIPAPINNERKIMGLREGEIKTVYEVYNKVFSLLFESKDDAGAFVSREATTINGLEVCERHMVPKQPESRKVYCWRLK